MKKAFLDILTAYWKKHILVADQTQQQKLRILIFDEYLNRYVRPDELLIPGEKENTKAAVQFTKPRENVVFDLLLKKFINPKLDLLTPGITNFDQWSQIHNYSTNNVWGKSIKKQPVFRIPSEHGIKTNENTGISQVGWAGQIVKKAVTDPRPELGNSELISSLGKDAKKNKSQKKKNKRKKFSLFDSNEENKKSTKLSKEVKENIRSNKQNKIPKVKSCLSSTSKNGIQEILKASKVCLRTNDKEKELCKKQVTKEASTLDFPKNLSQEKGNVNVFKKLCSGLFSNKCDIAVKKDKYSENTTTNIQVTLKENASLNSSSKDLMKDISKHKSEGNNNQCSSLTAKTSLQANQLKECFIKDQPSSFLTTIKNTEGTQSNSQQHKCSLTSNQDKTESGCHPDTKADEPKIFPESRQQDVTKSNERREATVMLSKDHLRESYLGSNLEKIKEYCKKNITLSEQPLCTEQLKASDSDFKIKKTASENLKSNKSSANAFNYNFMTRPKTAFLNKRSLETSNLNTKKAIKNCKDLVQTTKLAPSDTCNYLSKSNPVKNPLKEKISSAKDKCSELKNNTFSNYMTNNKKVQSSPTTQSSHCIKPTVDKNAMEEEVTEKPTLKNAEVFQTTSPKEVDSKNLNVKHKKKKISTEQEKTSKKCAPSSLKENISQKALVSNCLQSVKIDSKATEKLDHIAQEKYFDKVDDLKTCNSYMGFKVMKASTDSLPVKDSTHNDPKSCNNKTANTKTQKLQKLRPKTTISIKQTSCQKNKFKELTDENKLTADLNDKPCAVPKEQDCKSKVSTISKKSKSTSKLKNKKIKSQYVYEDNSKNKNKETVNYTTFDHKSAVKCKPSKSISELKTIKDVSKKSKKENATEPVKNKSIKLQSNTVSRENKSYCSKFVDTEETKKLKENLENKLTVQNNHEKEHIESNDTNCLTVELRLEDKSGLKKETCQHSKTEKTVKKVILDNNNPLQEEHDFNSKTNTTHVECQEKNDLEAKSSRTETKALKPTKNKKSKTKKSRSKKRTNSPQSEPQDCATLESKPKKKKKKKKIDSSSEKHWEREPLEVQTSKSAKKSSGQEISKSANTVSKTVSNKLESNKNLSDVQGCVLDTTEKIEKQVAKCESSVKKVKKSEPGRHAVICSKSLPNLKPEKPDKVLKNQSSLKKSNVKLNKRMTSSPNPSEFTLAKVNTRSSKRSLSEDKHTKTCSLHTLQSRVMDDPVRSSKRFEVKSFSEIKAFASPKVNFPVQAGEPTTLPLCMKKKSPHQENCSLFDTEDSTPIKMELKKNILSFLIKSNHNIVSNKLPRKKHSKEVVILKASQNIKNSKVSKNNISKIKETVEPKYQSLNKTNNIKANRPTVYKSNKELLNTNKKPISQAIPFVKTQSNTKVLNKIKPFKSGSNLEKVSLGLSTKQELRRLANKAALDFCYSEGVKMEVKCVEEINNEATGTKDQTYENLNKNDTQNTNKRRKKGLFIVTDKYKAIAHNSTKSQKTMETVPKTSEFEQNKPKLATTNPSLTNAVEYPKTNNSLFVNQPTADNHEVVKLPFEDKRLKEILDKLYPFKNYGVKGYNPSKSSDKSIHNRLKNLKTETTTLSKSQISEMTTGKVGLVGSKTKLLEKSEIKFDGFKEKSASSKKISKNENNQSLTIETIVKRPVSENRKFKHQPEVKNKSF